MELRIGCNFKNFQCITKDYQSGIEPYITKYYTPFTNFTIEDTGSYVHYKIYVDGLDSNNSQFYWDIRRDHTYEGTVKYILTGVDKSSFQRLTNRFIRENGLRINPNLVKITLVFTNHDDGFSNIRDQEFSRTFLYMKDESVHNFLVFQSGDPSI